jgi:hypothetical protein
MKWLGCVTLVGGVRTWFCDACLWGENMGVWLLFVSWECGCVAVCEMKIWMCDACMWATNVDLWRLLVRWKYGSVTLVCELRMWMCGCLWDENMDVWERTCVTLVCERRMWMCVCEMKVWMCDACMWAENVDLWRLFVDENADVVVIGRGRQCSLYKCESILKLETALWYLHTRQYDVPFWLWRDLKSACSPLTVHSYSS